MSVAAVRAERSEAISNAVASLRPEIVQALQALVRIPSQTGCEGPAQDAVAILMRAHGLDVDVWEPDPGQLAPYADSLTLDGGFADRPNVVGTCRGRGGGRSLILNGHIDTVEVGYTGAWTTAPLGGEVVDGRLFGRGSCDMKGGLVGNLFALRALRDAGLAPAGDVIIESTVSEEDGGAGALAAILRGYVADAALIAEPTNLAVIVAHGGSLMFRLHVPGLSAHACVRDEGVSAIEKFAYLHRGLLDFESRHNRQIAHPLYAEMSNKAPLNIGTISGGAWPSSVPEAVVAEGRAGLVPGEDLETLKSQLAVELDGLADADPWLRSRRPRFEWLHGQFAPSDVPGNHPFVTAVQGAFIQVTGTNATVAAATYGADMRHFVNTGGMPCLMFGAGDVRLAHAPDESMLLDDLLTAVSTLAVLIADWCGVEPS